MRSRDYGQVCGLAHALELVGERWAMLVVRELILGPKRFTDLRRGLPRIPTNVLSARLKDLERGGVLRRTLAPRPGGPVLYELTEYGQELEDIVVRLGFWGAKTMGEPRPGDTLSADALRLALLGMFQAERARDLRARYVVRVGETVVNLSIGRGTVEASDGVPPDSDLEIETDPGGLHALLSGAASPSELLECGAVTIAGPVAELERFARLFQLETAGAAPPR